jgi:hypothetical protein
MSTTTFDVYPGTASIPTFQQLLDRSTTHLHRFLVSVGVAARPAIHARLHIGRDEERFRLDLQTPLRWPEDTYAWFWVGESACGADAYFLPVEQRTLDRLSTLTDRRFKAREELIHSCFTIGHYWSFRRSGIQPAAIDIAYGLLAASLAELTSGFVHSDDSAWDSERMPALSHEFFEWYFVPELALHDNFREWSVRSIGALREELGA